MHHTIQPKNYSLSYGVQAPLAEIDPGDTVTTRMLDCHGGDEHNQPAGPTSNPLTGPFVVCGAMPGDALTVTIHALTPNRPTGFANPNIHPDWLEAQTPPVEYPKEYVEWEIDTEKNTIHPLGGHFPGRDVELPLKPVLGCIGLAANANDAIESITCGSFGGNLDYPRATTGTTLYLPIAVEGAYLYVGDAHAVQGAGEITGNGVEISCDITFSVKVVKMNIRNPRGEDATHLFTLGCALPLERTVQIATSEMQTWLCERYGLSNKQIGILMGQLAQYEIGNLVNPNYSSACLMAKEFLDDLFIVNNVTQNLPQRR